MAKSYKDTTDKVNNPVERLACPLCGWIRPVKWGYSKRTGEAREVRFDKVDVMKAPIWRLEKLTGKGRGSKDASIELIESKTLSELPPELKAQIKEQCKKILTILA